MPDKPYPLIQETAASVSSLTQSARQPVRALFSLLLLQLAFGFVYSWGAVVPYVRQFDHWSPLLTSAVFSSGPLGYATGMVISGRLAERYAPRSLCWVGAGLMVAGFLITFLFPSGFTFIVFYSAIGLGLGGSIAMAGSLAAGIALFPGRVGMIGGALTGSYALAAIVEAPLVGVLAAMLGWLNALRGVGGGVALMAVCAMLIMPAVSRPGHTRDGSGVISFRQLVGRNAIRVGILLEATATPLGSYAFAAIAVYTHTLHLDLWVATVAVIAVAGGNALGRIAGGAASDRFGVERVFLVIFGTGLLAALLLSLASGPVAVLLAALCAGISFGGPAGVLSRLAAVSAPDAPHAAFGLLFAGFAIGAFYGPLLGAAVGGLTAWWVLGGLVVIGWLTLLGRMAWSWQARGKRLSLHLRKKT